MVEMEPPSKKARIKEKHWPGKVALQNNGSLKLCSGFNIMIVLNVLQCLTVWLRCKLQNRDYVSFSRDAWRLRQHLVSPLEWLKDE